MRAVHTSGGHALILTDDGGLVGLAGEDLPSNPLTEAAAIERDVADALRNLNPKGTDE